MNYGKHLIIDIWGEVASFPFWNMDKASEVLKEAALISGATFLNERWHHFGNGCGYTGVIVLAESHISIHTWPETGFAAIDMYMCGDADPRRGIHVIEEWFKPYDMQITEIKRGIDISYI